MSEINTNKIWLTSDTHFNHQRTLELSKRPFANLDEMNKTIIAKWNRLVGKDDTVIHLGDFGEPQFLKNLNGRIILLPGNYEREALKTDPNYYDILKENSNKDMPIAIIDSDHINLVPCAFFNSDEYRNFFTMVHLTHEPPINSQPMKDTHICNLFGHIHKLQMVKQYGLNVGTDAHNFEPIDIERVEFYLGGIMKHYDENVFF